MKRSSAEEIIEVEDGQPCVEPLGRKIGQICCDCKLTHAVRYDLSAEGKLIVRAWRDDATTRRLRAQARRAKARKRAHRS